MSKRQILDREARFALPAALCAIVAPVLIVGSLVAAGQLDLPTTGLATESIRAFEANSTALLALSAVRAIGFLLLVPPLLFLWQATRARRPELPGTMIGFAFIGPVLLAVQGVLGYLGQQAVASDFVAQSVAGGDIYTLLDDLTDDSSISAAAGGMGFAAILGVGVAMVYFPLQAMRAGLLTRFFATLGMALGGATVLLARPDPDPRHALVPVAGHRVHRPDATRAPARLGCRRGDSLAAARGRAAAEVAGRGRG